MSTMFQQPIETIIQARRSIRAYDTNPIPPSLEQQLQQYIQWLNEQTGPFGNSINVSLIQPTPQQASKKLGTYGVIHGAQYYLTARCQKSAPHHLEDLGYLFEQLVLYCTSLSLGTVWLGGTFQKGEFAKIIELQPDQILPIISPVGLEGNKKTLLGKLFGSNHLNRQPFEQKFYNQDFNTPLLPQQAGAYSSVLEMVRLAPSAMNKQPWVVVKQQEQFHFYNQGKIALSQVDMGIALCHFHLTAQEKQLKGRFVQLSPPTEQNHSYVITWIADQQ